VLAAPVRLRRFWQAAFLGFGSACFDFKRACSVAGGVLGLLVAGRREIFKGNFAERPALLRTADVGLEGAVGEEREHDIGTAGGGFDFFRPAVAGFQVLAPSLWA
jgi:hypothetical protein